MVEVTIIVATFGSFSWISKAKEACASAEAQTMSLAQVIRVHGATLHGARNTGAADADTEWLVFLDGDDTLSPGYVEAMLAGDGDLRQPQTLGVYPDGHTDPPVFIPPRGANLLAGNHLVIGTMVRKEFFDAVGGFRDLPAWEDYDLFTRCWLAGATVGKAPGAVYRVTVNPGGRNDLDPAMAQHLFAELRGEYEPIARAKGLL